MTVYELHEKYKADLAELQRLCPHYTAFPWEYEYWAPGHATGSKVRRCEHCGIVVQREDGYPELGNVTIIINTEP